MLICLHHFIHLIEAFGALSTVGTFIYLIIDRNKQQEQINALTKLALTEERKLRLSLMPNFVDLKLMNISVQTGSEFALDFNNKGGRAIIDSIKEINNKLSFRFTDTYIQSVTPFRIVCKSLPNENPVQSDYEIEIIFNDILEGKYSQKIIITKGGCRFLPAKKI